MINDATYPAVHLGPLCIRLEEKYANGTLDMELALKAFRRLKDEFQQEFTEFELQVRYLHLSQGKSPFASGNNALWYVPKNMQRAQFCKNLHNIVWSAT